MNLEDYVQSVFEERLSLNKVAQKDLTDMNTNVQHILETREKFTRVTTSLEAQKEEMQMKQESLREREENIKMEEEILKNKILHYDKFLQENDARRERAVKKAEAERIQITQKELEIQNLKSENDALMAQEKMLEERVRKATCYHEFLERAAKLSGKFESPGHIINRLKALRSVNKELLDKQTMLEKERESARLRLIEHINKERSVLQHHNNKLHQLQTQLDSIRLEAYKWELKLKHFHSTAAKETLEFAQLKTTIRNIHQMVRAHHKRRVSEDTEDTFKQLEMIQKYFHLMVAIDEELKFMTMPDRSEKDDSVKL